jgi:DNA-binding transcriptional MerR regulator
VTPDAPSRRLKPRVLYSRIVPEPVVEIPNRPAFRASEVCEIAQIPPYVLKSWEKEFPGLGTASKPGGPRVYRRSDVEQVVRIKRMLFTEGLTLAGVRRKLEGEPKPEEEPLPDLGVPGEVRDKVARVKQDLRALLDLLSSPSTAASAIAIEQQPPPPEAGAAPAIETPGSAAATASDTTEARESDLPLLDGTVEDARLQGSSRARRPSRRAPGRGADAS